MNGYLAKTGIIVTYPAIVGVISRSDHSHASIRPVDGNLSPIFHEGYAELRIDSVCAVGASIGNRAAPYSPASLPISAIVTTVCFSPFSTLSGAVME
jgi:hypothetical protein